MLQSPLSRKILVSRILCGLFLLMALATRGSGQDTAPKSPDGKIDGGDWPSFQKIVQPFFAKNCLQCHDQTEKGDVRVDLFTDEVSLVKGVATVEKAMDMIRKHAMPPKEQPQPSDDEIKPVLAWMASFVERVERQTPADPGRVVVRRLNRTEYNNTVRDLLGVVFQPADDFPPDDSGHGFDNIGAALTMSPTLMEKYLSAAEKVARTALFGVESIQVEKTAHQPYFTADAFSKNRAVKFDYDETGLSLASALHVVQRFPVEGEYALRGIMRGVRPAGSDPIEMGIWLDGKLIDEFKLPVPAKAGGGRDAGEVNGLWAETRTRVPAGEHWLAVTILRMYEGLPQSFKGPNPSQAATGTGRAAVDSFFPMYLDVVGPYNPAKGPTEESLQKIFGSTPRAAKHARHIVADLARRAYRRPVTDQEVDELMKLVDMVQESGESFEEGLCVAIQRMLVSPHFLFRVELASAKETASGADQATDSHLISQHELATRLSYFLWSSMPDEELRRSADNQELRQPDVLRAQVTRMLKDDKALSLVENFGGQWLMTRALESHTPDRVKFVEFTDYTRMSMKKETDLFFSHIIRDDRSILDFIDGNYTFLNQRLAEFYGITDVKGHEFRKVDLTGTQRGGVFTQASVLTVSSYANRTSPVLRGKWLLENFLNAPPPPPPADVPFLNEQVIGKSASLREELEKHRADAGCASCHSRMDPLGLALENFDAIGRWRDKEGQFDIDPAGTLPDGRSFNGPQELRAILKSEPRVFAECIVDKMLTYALGRGLERYDRTTVRGIADRAARNDYRFSSVVLGIVESVPFQMRRESRDIE